VQGTYTLFNRIAATLSDLFKLPKAERQDTLTVVSFPTLHRPVFLATLFNRFFLARFIRKYGIDIVVNGSYYLFTLPENHGVEYFVDLADLPSADESADFVDRYTRIEIAKARVVTTASNALAVYAREHYSKEAVFMPNGFDRSKMGSVTDATLTALKKQYGVTGKFVIGYIGNIGEWMDIDMAVNAFRKFKTVHPSSAMMWIGHCSQLEQLRSRYESDDIIFTGSIDKDIERYFRLIDVGIIPSKPSKFQDFAFHIKLVEYTAANRPVVSTYSRESDLLGFPNVIFRENDKDVWAKAFEDAMNMKWQPGWDQLSRQFDWDTIMSKYDKLFSENDKSRSGR